jgi:hypothetical protein
MRADIEEFIRRYPTQGVLTGFGIGYVLGRTTRR